MLLSARAEAIVEKDSLIDGNSAKNEVVIPEASDTLKDSVSVEEESILTIEEKNIKSSDTENKSE